MPNLEVLIDKPYLCRWPKEWTIKVNALKKFIGEARCIEEFRNEIRMMNCMKMYGLDIAQEGYLRVRDHRSRGAPFIFWNHNSK
jgi:hypothetical protein